MEGDESPCRTLPSPLAAQGHQVRMRYLSVASRYPKSSTVQVMTRLPHESLWCELHPAAREAHIHEDGTDAARSAGW